MFDSIKIKQDNHIMQTKTHAVNPSMALKQQHSRSSSKQDTAELSHDWQNRTNWAARTKDTLEQLQQSYPGIDILISESLSDGALHSTAASLGSGMHLILSEDFISKMSENQEQYNKYKNILSQALSELSKKGSSHDASGIYLTGDSRTEWYADHTQKPEGMFPSDSKNNKSGSFGNLSNTSGDVPSQNFRMKVKPSYKTSGSYARLAGAASKSQVRTVLGEVQRNIVSLRIASVYGDEKERKKAKAAITSLNKLLLRGNQKLRRLHSEEILKLRQKRAEQKQAQERVARIKAELSRKRTERRTSDGALMLEGRLDDIGRDYYHKKYKAYEYNLPVQPSFIPVTPTIPASGLLPSDSGVSFAMSEVVITDSSKF